MKSFTLSLRDLFWLVALVAMGLGWWLRSRSDSFPFHSSALDLRMMLVHLLFSAPLWCLLLFVTYALGKRKLTRPTIIVFCATELASFALIAGLRELGHRLSH